MLEFLKSRAAFISYLIGLFGGVLSSLIDVSELNKIYFVGLATFLALATSLLISFLLKFRWIKAAKKKLQIISVIAFFLTIIALISFLYQLDRLTFTYSEKVFNEKTNQIDQLPSKKHLRGSWYQKKAKYIMDTTNKNPDNMPLNDSTLLRDYYGGQISNLSGIWSAASVRRSKIILYLGYDLFIILLCGLISMLTEVLSSKYKSRKHAA